MKKRRGISLRIVLVLLATSALVLALPPSQARAVDCATASDVVDTDLDGFPDAQECEGLWIATGASLDFPGRNSDLERALRLDPDTPDLFVILVPAAPSNIPANSLELVSKPQAEGGLGMTCHVITPTDAGPDRGITSKQKAVRITESLDPNGNILGIANYGTPNQLDLCVVYTERIKNHVYSVYGEVGKTPPDGLIDTYIKHTIAHEVGHMTRLAVEYNRRFGGYHYKTGSKVVMEQAVKYTKKGTKITFYISTEYAPADRPVLH